MLQESIHASDRAIRIVEDGRTPLQIIRSLDANGLVAGDAYADLIDMAKHDAYIAHAGTPHAIALIPAVTIVQQPYTLAQLLSVGAEAGLQKYPFVVALQAAEQLIEQDTDPCYVYFAHQEALLPCVENQNRFRKLILSLAYEETRPILRVMRIKAGRPFNGTPLIAFGSPSDIEQ